MSWHYSARKRPLVASLSSGCRLPLLLSLPPSPPATYRLPAPSAPFVASLSSGYRLPAPSPHFVASLSSPPATGSLSLGSLSSSCWLPLLRLPAPSPAFVASLSSGYRLPAPSPPFFASLSSPPATGYRLPLLLSLPPSPLLRLPAPSSPLVDFPSSSSRFPLLLSLPPSPPAPGSRLPLSSSRCLPLIRLPLPLLLSLLPSPLLSSPPLPSVLCSLTLFVCRSFLSQSQWYIFYEYCTCTQCNTVIIFQIFDYQIYITSIRMCIDYDSIDNTV